MINILDRNLSPKLKENLDTKNDYLKSMDLTLY